MSDERLVGYTDNIIEYLDIAIRVVETYSFGNHVEMQRAAIEIAKMIQLEEHLETQCEIEGKLEELENISAWLEKLCDGLNSDD